MHSLGIESSQQDEYDQEAMDNSGLLGEKFIDGRMLGE